MDLKKAAARVANLDAADHADLIIERLNEILGHDSEALEALIEARVPCNASMRDHPSVQVSVDGEQARVGFLGVLNGLVGTIPSGEKEGWGYIAASFDDDTGKLLRFVRTDRPDVEPSES